MNPTEELEAENTVLRVHIESLNEEIERLENIISDVKSLVQ